MTNEQTTSATGPVDMGTVLNDIEAWYTRAIVRMFYPNTASSVSISMPDTVGAFHKSVPTVTAIPADQREAIQKNIFTLRDAVTALVAQGISGRVPDYSAFIQFQKNYSEFIRVLRYAMTIKEPVMPVSKPLPRGEAASPMPTAPETPAVVTSDPMVAFTSAHNALSDDTPLKRYVRGLKTNRSGHKG